jgi:hypothetical protein
MQDSRSEQHANELHSSRGTVDIQRPSMRLCLSIHVPLHFENPRAFSDKMILSLELHQIPATMLQFNSISLEENRSGKMVTSKRLGIDIKGDIFALLCHVKFENNFRLSSIQLTIPLGNLSHDSHDFSHSQYRCSTTALISLR